MKTSSDRINPCRYVCALLQWGICSSCSLSPGNSCSFMLPHTTANKPELAYVRYPPVIFLPVCVCLCVEGVCVFVQSRDWEEKHFEYYEMIMEIGASVRERVGETADGRCHFHRVGGKKLHCLVRIHLMLQLKQSYTDALHQTDSFTH